MSGRAIDGLFEHLFKLSFPDLPIEEDSLKDRLSDRFNNYLGAPERIHVSNEADVYFPGWIQKEESMGQLQVEPLPSSRIDVSVGWNLSKQWNPQIGFSWKKYSVFADFSWNCHWTDSLTHDIDIAETSRSKVILPSKYITGMGFGLRWYPLNKDLGWFPFNRIELGLSLSVQTGVIYGESEIYNEEQIPRKDYLKYLNLAPAASLRFYPSKNHLWMCYFNVGYAFYFPYSINLEMKSKPYMTNFGVSIPFNSFNRNLKKGGKQ